MNLLDWFISSGQEVMLQDVEGGERGLGHSHVLQTHRKFFRALEEEQSGEIPNKKKTTPSS